MPGYDYDLLVIGAGSGGVRAARLAAAQGGRVAVAEELRPGGTCVNAGCVPKKLFVYAAQFAEAFRESVGFGWEAVTPSFDWGRLRANKDAEIERLNGLYRELLGGSGCDLLEGRATLRDAHTVNVGGRDYRAERILIACGGEPHVPEFPGRELVITSDQVFAFERLPERVLVVGGGYIAVEFAGIFAGLGVETRLAYRGELFLRGFDRDIRLFVAAEIAKKGVALAFNSVIEQVERLADGTLRVTYQDGRRELTDCVVYATGRRAKTAGLGLENTRVRLRDNGAILVDRHYRTDEPSIYAIGDVIERGQLTPVALAQGMALVNQLYGGRAPEPDLELIPTAVFSQPNIATVGLSEEQARARFAQVAVYRSEFRALKQSLAGGDERTLVKLLVDPASDRVLGAHMVGPEAGEIIQGIAIALRAGATKQVFDSTLGIHPTLAEEFVCLRTPAA